LTGVSGARTSIRLLGVLDPVCGVLVLVEERGVLGLRGDLDVGV
jgi:hypothetical protein